VKAGTGEALKGDHERKAVAAPAPDFHVLDGTVELQGHQQLFTYHLSSNSPPREISGQKRPESGVVIRQDEIEARWTGISS
jgi:hypothetical protein